MLSFLFDLPGAIDNTINKVVEEGFSPEELEERQLKIQVSNDLKQKPLMLLLQLIKFCI